MSWNELGLYLLNNQLTFELAYRNVIKTARCGFHSHGSFELVYHIKGSGMFTVNGKRIPFQEKSLAIHPPRIRHDQTTSVPGEDACIHFSAPEKLSREIGDYLCVQSIDRLTVAEDFLNLCDDPAPITVLEKAACNHAISAIVARILAATDTQSMPGQSPDTDYASAAFRYLRENNGTINNLEEVAGKIGISYDHLRHLFRQKFGKSMKEQLSGMRLDKAKQLLAQTPLPLKAIAGMCGYTSDRYFCMAFKTAEGMTPGEFRKKR